MTIRAAMTFTFEAADEAEALAVVQAITYPPGADCVLSIPSPMYSQSANESGDVRFAPPSP
jgi:hypothetical protein